ncbi:MAG: hypothetical protein ACE37K_09940 [Planctomycetota bacterium]
MSRSHASSSSPVFKVFAVVIAIGVVGYLVYHAQQGADRRQAQRPGQAAPQPVDGDGGGGAAGDQPDAVLLPSSKDVVLEEPLLSSSKSGSVPIQDVQPAPLLPSSKVLVIPAEPAASGEKAGPAGGAPKKPAAGAAKKGAGKGGGKGGGD